MDSVVLFGSQVSGGSDKQSDQDLLVVCEPNKKTSSIKKYSKLGYSVSVYSPKQLSLMKKKGSLFLQHLRKESEVLYDHKDLFRNFIVGCDFIPPSNEEVQRTKCSIVNSMRCPKDNYLSWWQADYIFVLSRDYFVKYFAAKGFLVFNFRQLCVEIGKEFSLAPHEVDLFVSLREFKSLYRSSGPQGYSVANRVDGWIQVLSKILNYSTSRSYNKYEYLSCRNNDSFESTYEILRYVESLRMLFPHVRHESKIEQYMENMISSPNHYSSTSVKGKEFLMDYLFRFRQMANKLKHADLGAQSPLFQKSRPSAQAVGLGVGS